MPMVRASPRATAMSGHLRMYRTRRMYARRRDRSITQRRYSGRISLHPHACLCRLFPLIPPQQVRHEGPDAPFVSGTRPAVQEADEGLAVEERIVAFGEQFPDLTGDRAVEPGPEGDREAEFGAHGNGVGQDPGG